MLFCVIPSSRVIIIWTLWFLPHFILSSSNEHYLHRHIHHHPFSSLDGRDSSGGELGDSWISDTSRDGLFASLDNDGNGKVTVEELTQV
jgi:hypothetical protein